MNLADLLDDLAETAVPPPVAPAALWTAGRRRRRARQARTALAVLALVGVLALLLPSTGVTVPSPGYARTSSAGVDGHPERIGRQWVVRDLPDRPGPLAALLRAVVEEDTFDRPDGWYGVRADGYRWRLPEVEHQADLAPVLSPDGRKLGYLEARDGPYVVRDLVTGDRTAFPGLVSPAGGRGGLPLLQQHPSFWSPDGHTLLLRVADEVAVLDTTTGRRTALPRLRVASLAGFAGDGVLAWLDRPDPLGELRVTTTDLRGRVLSEAGLEGTAGSGPVSQYSGAAGAGGAIAYVQERGVRVFFVAGGDPTQDGLRVVEPTGVCPVAWGSAGELAVNVLDRGAGLRTRVVVGPGRGLTTVVADSVGGRCLVWAADALSGPGRGGGVLGTTALGLAWYWRELLLGTVALAGLVVLVVRRRRARMHRS